MNLRVRSISLSVRVLVPGNGFKMVLCPHSGYPSCLSSTLLKMQKLGGRLREVVAYESRTSRAKFSSQPRRKWYIYSKKKIMKVYFSVPIMGSFIDKIISYSF